MKRSGKKFTLLELLVVVAIIGILASIIIPALGRAREKAKFSTCTARLKNVGILVQIYYADGIWVSYPVPNNTAELIGNAETVLFEVEDKMATCPLSTDISYVWAHPDIFSGAAETPLAKDQLGSHPDYLRLQTVYEDSHVEKN